MPAWETIRKNCTTCASPVVDWMPSCASSDRLCPNRFCGFGRRSRQYCARLGHARDLDVALSELEAFSRGLPKSDREGVEPLKQHLVSERGRARARMLSVLDSVWVQKNLQELTSLLAAPSAASQPAITGVGAECGAEIDPAAIPKVTQGRGPLTPDSSMEAYHEVRGQVKKLRYALEAVAVIYGKPADEMLRALRRWQEKLGVQQDAAVASRRLKALAGAPPKGIPPETLFLMGRLAEHYAGAAAAGAQALCKGLSKSSRKMEETADEVRGFGCKRCTEASGSGP